MDQAIRTDVAIIVLPGPAYAVLGNHDYETCRGNKVEIELAYTNHNSRWTMPRRWYSVKLPKEKPLLTLICLDSNFPGSKELDLWPWSFVLTRQQHDEQQRWVEAELEKPRSTHFLALSGASSSVQQWKASRQSNADRPMGFSVATPRRRSAPLRPRSRSPTPRVQRASHFIRHFWRRRRRTRRLDDIPKRTGTMGPTSGRFYRPADLAGDLVVRHIGKDATVLCEFKKSLDITQRI